MKHQLDDTIAAIITPPGVGGVGAIRISGVRARSILNKVFFSKSPIKDHFFRYGAFHLSKNLKESAMAVYLAGPRSFTGEDTTEIYCHGSPLLLSLAIKRIIACGARLAEPGEFSKRAYLNGRIDLTKAEAIIDIVQAKSRASLSSALAQLHGDLASINLKIKAGLVKALAQAEASIDFPDDVKSSGSKEVKTALILINIMIKGGEEGRVLREGLRVAIVGKPNVGKSSLLNALLGENRVIVTEMPGTTRDTIEECLVINGLPMIVIDTAGIRHPKGKAEKFGVQKAREEMETADLTLVVVDGSRTLTREDRVVIADAPKYNSIVVLNKLDLGKRVISKQIGDNFNTVALSARTGEGLERLRRAIVKTAKLGSYETARIKGHVNARQAEALMRGKESLLRAIEASKRKLGGECVAIEIKEAIAALDEVSGEAVSQEIIESIFSRFCVGK